MIETRNNHVSEVIVKQMRGFGDQTKKKKVLESKWNSPYNMELIWVFDQINNNYFFFNENMITF